MGSHKFWTEAERDYLESAWGSRSIPHIAAHLGRSESAIENKASKMRLGAHILASDRISASAVVCALLGYSTGRDIVAKWQRAGLPVHKHMGRARSVPMLDMREFWKWAEHNKPMLNFARFEAGALGKEPAWVEEKRRHDQRENLPKTPWTRAEDMMLEALLRQGGRTYADLARVIQRSQSAIGTRIHDLCLDVWPARTPRKPWNHCEDERLVAMARDGRTWDAIGNALSRTSRSVRSRYEALQRGA